METIKDTGIKYINGDIMLEGDKVIFKYYEFASIPEEIECEIKYKNGAFYLVSDLLLNGKPVINKTVASVFENNAEIPEKYPMYIIKI